MANLPHSYQFFLFFCRLLLLGSDKKKKLLVHLTVLNLNVLTLKKSEQPNWIINTNLGLVTIRGGYCDLNVRFPHLHLRNKLVKTFFVSRPFSFKTQLHQVGFEMLGEHAKKPTCSSPEIVNDTAALDSRLVNSTFDNNSSSLRIICIWNQCSLVPGNVFKFHLQLDLPRKSFPKATCSN